MQILNLTQRDKFLLIISIFLGSCIGVATANFLRDHDADNRISPLFDSLTISGSIAGMLLGIIWFFIGKKFLSDD